MEFMGNLESNSPASILARSIASVRSSIHQKKSRTGSDFSRMRPKKVFMGTSLESQQRKFCIFALACADTTASLNSWHNWRPELPCDSVVLPQTYHTHEQGAKKMDLFFANAGSKHSCASRFLWNTSLRNTLARHITRHACTRHPCVCVCVLYYKTLSYYTVATHFCGYSRETSLEIDR